MKLLRSNAAKLKALVAAFALVAFSPRSASADIIQVVENWERLEITDPNATFRNYTAAEFNQAIPEWRADTYVELQHEGRTWGGNRNDDYLEIDLELTSTPQIFTQFVTAENQGLDSVQFIYDTAGRPVADHHLTQRLALYGRYNGGAWYTLDSVDVEPSNASVPIFSTREYLLSFLAPFTGTFEFGFGCVDCSARRGYGPLLGTVRALYDVDAISSGGAGGGGNEAPTEIPEPATALLFGSALFMLQKKRKEALAN